MKKIFNKTIKTVLPIVLGILILYMIYADFDFTIMQVIDTSLGFINRNNKISLKTEFEGNSTTILHGNYFGTIYDIFHDILNNVLEYEQNHNVDRTCRIVMEEVNDYLNIKVITDYYL